jgi:hypothetical protein
MVYIYILQLEKKKGVTKETLLLQSLGDPLFTILVVYCFSHSCCILSQRCCYYSMGLLCIFSHDNKSRSELSSSDDSSGSFSTVFWLFLFIFGLFSKFNLSVKPSSVVLRNSKTGLRFVSSRQMFGVIGFLIVLCDLSLAPLERGHSVRKCSFVASIL